MKQHLDQFGLKVVNRDADREVTSVVCRFCTAFGQDEIIGKDIDDGSPNNRQRKQISNKKYFTNFRTDNYKAHMVTQHSIKRMEYEKIMKDEESIAKFFKTKVLFVNKLDSHFLTGQSKKFDIQKDIIEILIAEMLFDETDEKEQMTKERVLKMFTIKPIQDVYTYKIKNLQLFCLCL